MRGRISAETLAVLARDALAEALGSALPFEVEPGDEGDLVLDTGAGRVQLDVRAAAVPSTEAVARLIREPAPAGRVPVLVADRVLGPVRVLLREAGWGWLDRRGHLHLEGPGVLIDRELDPVPRPGSPPVPAPVSGRSGVSLALALLMEPDEPPGVRETARRCGFSPAAISQARTRLTDAALVDAAGRPLVPELFWVLAETWAGGVRRVGVGRTPELGDDGSELLDLGFADLEAPGWAAAGAHAAIAWGAPLVEAGLDTVDFYVPTAVVLRRAQKMLGPPGATPGARLALAPTRLVVSPRHSAGGPLASRWPLVHPVVAALDLTLDPSRGHEALEAWDPPAGFRRVW